MLRILIGITCRNAELTIGHVLESVCGLRYPRDLLHVLVVDAESSDSTVKIVEKALTRYGISHEVIVRRCTIPEGRNMILDYAKEHDFNVVLFVDADVVIHDKKILTYLTDIVNKHGDGVYMFRFEYRNFRSIQELEEFARKIVSGDISHERIVVRCVPWCQMALTAVTRNVFVNVRFDHDLTFSEDVYYGLEAWTRGYKVCHIVGTSPFGYDLNLRRRNSLYVNMSLRDYLRGLRKKSTALAYKHYRGTIVETLLDFATSREGKKLLYHTVCALALASALLSLLSGSLFLSLVLSLFYVVGTLAYATRLALDRCRICNILRCIVKQQLTSPLLFLLSLMSLAKFHRTFRSIHGNISKMNSLSFFGS